MSWRYKMEIPILPTRTSHGYCVPTSNSLMHPMLQDYDLATFNEAHYRATRAHMDVPGNNRQETGVD